MPQPPSQPQRSNNNGNAAASINEPSPPLPENPSLPPPPQPLPPPNPASVGTADRLPGLPRTDPAAEGMLIGPGHPLFGDAGAEPRDSVPMGARYDPIAPQGIPEEPDFDELLPPGVPMAGGRGGRRPGRGRSGVFGNPFDAGNSSPNGSFNPFNGM